MSSKEIIRSERGVTVTKVTLFGGMPAMPISIAYSVISKRTPEVRQFGDEGSALKYFAEEVARSAAQG